MLSFFKIFSGKYNTALSSCYSCDQAAGHMGGELGGKAGMPFMWGKCAPRKALARGRLVSFVGVSRSMKASRQARKTHQMETRLGFCLPALLCQKNLKPALGTWNLSSPVRASSVLLPEFHHCPSAQALLTTPLLCAKPRAPSRHHSQMFQKDGARQDDKLLGKSKNQKQKKTQAQLLLSLCRPCFSILIKTCWIPEKIGQRLTALSTLQAEMWRG